MDCNPEMRHVHLVYSFVKEFTGTLTISKFISVSLF